MFSLNDLTYAETAKVSTRPLLPTMFELFQQSEDLELSYQDGSAKPEFVDYTTLSDAHIKDAFYNTGRLGTAPPVTSVNADSPVVQTLQKDFVKAEYTPNQVTSRNCVDELRNQALHACMEEFQLFLDNFVNNGSAEYTHLMPSVDNQIQQTSMEQFQWTTSNHFLNGVPQISTTISTPKLEVDLTTNKEDSSSLSDHNVTRKAKRQRIKFCGWKLLTLEREFQKNPFLSRLRRAELSSELGIADKKIKVWFQNRRVRTRKTKPQKEAPTVRTATEDFGNSTIQAFKRFQVLPGSTGHASDQHWWFPGNGCY